MMSNFFKIALRHLLRDKVFTSINLAGLTLGMTCALFAILFVRDKMSYDQFHLNANRLYRLNTIITKASDGTQHILGTTGQVQGPAFKAAIPEIKNYVRILGSSGSYCLWPASISSIWILRALWKDQKKIGVRKIIGGSRKNIILQFMTEAALFFATAYLLAIFLSKLLLPLFNLLSGKNISLSISEDASFFIAGLSLLIVCAVIAGLW